MFSENSTLDMVGHGVYAFGPTKPIIFINDTRSPELSEFVEFNLLTGQISLRFTEAVDNSSFNFTAITLLSLFERPLQSYRLTNGEIVTTIDNTIVVIQLAVDDIVAIQRMIHICTYRGNCYIVVSDDLVTDTSGNPVLPINMTPPGKIVTTFIDDNEPPELVTSILNLNDSTLVMTFNEAVQASLVNTNGITLSETQDPSNSSFTYTLTGGTPRAISATVVEIRLTNGDISSIKDLGYGLNILDVYLTLAADTVFDMARDALGNDALLNGSMVTIYGDTSPPTVVSFSLNFQDNSLDIIFSEPVNQSLVSFSNFTLSANCSGGTSTMLTQNVVAPRRNINGLSLLIHADDLSLIKMDSTFGTNRDNVYLAITANAVVDLYGNGNVPLACTRSDALIEASSILSLVSFDYNMNTGNLSLLFTDIVDVASFRASGIIIQAGESRETGRYFQLTSTTRPIDLIGNELIVELSAMDKFSLDSIPGLATNQSNTYLTMRADTIDDTFGIDVRAVTDGKAMEVSTFVADNVSPSLVSFALFVDLGVLNLNLL